MECTSDLWKFQQRVDSLVCGVGLGLDGGGLRREPGAAPAGLPAGSGLNVSDLNVSDLLSAQIRKQSAQGREQGLGSQRSQDAECGAQEQEEGLRTAEPGIVAQAFAYKDLGVTDMVVERCGDPFCQCAECKRGKFLFYLIARLERFASCRMLTLTIDRALFDSPEAAYNHVVGYRHGRFGPDGSRIERSTTSAIPRVMEALLGRSLLSSGAWIASIEFQQSGGGWVHWHIVVDSDVDGKVLQHAIEQEWAKFIPMNRRSLVRASVTDTRHSLGYVKVTDPPGGRRNEKAAGLYLGKYVFKKLPAGQSWPDWVLDAKYRIPRVTHSRNFWVLPRRRYLRDRSRIRRHYRVRSHRERIASCRKILIFLRRQERIDLRTGEVKRVRQLVGKADVDGYALLDAVRANGYPEEYIYVRGGFLSAKCNPENLCKFLRPIVARGFGAGRLEVGAQFRVRLC